METHNKYLISFIIVLIAIIVIISLTFFSTFILISDWECGVTINEISIINVDKKIFLFNVISPISSLIMAIILPFFILKYQTEREKSDKKQLTKFIFDKELQSLKQNIENWYPYYENLIKKGETITLHAQEIFEKAEFNFSRLNILISNGLVMYLDDKDAFFNLYQQLDTFNTSTAIKKMNLINDIKIEFDKKFKKIKLK